MTIGLVAAALAAVLGAGGPEVSVAPTGAVSISWPGTDLCLGPVFLLIPKPKWKGSLFAQDGWDGAKVEKLGPGRFRITGRAEWQGGGMELIQTVTVQGGRVRISYKCTPLGDAETEGARIVARAPAEAFAGRGKLLQVQPPLCLVQPLPEKCPDNYHLAFSRNARAAGFALGHDVALISFAGTWLDFIAIQDDRKFKIPAFELQATIAGTKHLRARRSFSAEISVSLTALQKLERSGLTMVPAGDKWQLARIESFQSRGELAIGEVEWSARQGPMWQPVELKFDVSGTWDNPFDPEQIDVYAVIHGPGGIRLRQPAFACHDFKPLRPGSDLLQPVGRLHWRLRWTPTREGRWRVLIVARTPDGTKRRFAGAFLCTGRAGHGFIRRCKSTPYYFQFDDGTAYVPVGENICWDGDELLTAYERWMGRLSRAGGNYCRIWLVRWNMALEWTNKGYRRGYYYGLGRYSLDNAWRLDRVMEIARRNGIYIMLCLGYHGELMERQDYFRTNCWAENPYNAANGGPCGKPAEFWTNPQARRLYKQRLRYIIARWSAYPNILTWEFWNEVHAPPSWISEMADFLRRNDPYAHLITTTWADEQIWRLDGIDISQIHHYGVDESLEDSGPVLASMAYSATERVKKPFIIGEFGIDWKRSDRQHDPDGRATNFHNGLWASLASRAAGPAALWWWDNYVDPLNLYGQFTSIARFARLVDWTRFVPARPKQGPEFAFQTPPEPQWLEARVTLPWKWRHQPAGELSVPRRRNWHAGSATCILFGPDKKDLQSPLRLKLDMPADGAAEIRVDWVSSRARLLVKVDGKPAAERDFVCGPPGKGRYKKAKYLEQYKIWQCQFAEDIRVELPAGEHVLELQVTQGDWLTVPTIAIENYAPRLQAYILADDAQAIGWIHDALSTWKNDLKGLNPSPIPSCTLRFGPLSPGRWQVIYFDTWRGMVIGRRTITSDGGLVELSLPQFTRDTAFVLRRR